MKTFLKVFFVTIAVVLGSLTAFAQDNFTVTIPSTDKYSGLCKPEKANVGFSLPVKVKSNISDTCTISIDKQNTFSTRSEWFQVDKENLTIVKNQTITFTLTVKPPVGIQDGKYEFWLYFDATAKSGISRDFDQNGFTVIVDNSVPSILEFSAPSYGKTSTALQFIWDAYDQWSNYYTMENDTAGVDGVARYQIVLKNQSNQEVASKSYDANNVVDNRHTFTGLASNTQYTAYLTATDVAGNQKTSAGLPATTPPAAPANLTAPNTTYCSTTLSWLASDGATGYNIYWKTNGQSSTLINSSPVAGTSYTINNLTPNTSYTFFVVAVSNIGPSDASRDITVTTYALPTIIGASTVCPEGSTFSLSSLISGYSVSWRCSSNLAEFSSSGSSAVFKAIGYGDGWITASIITPTNQNLPLETKNVRVGRPYEIDVASIQYMNYIAEEDAYQIPSGSGNYEYDGVLTVSDYGNLATDYTWTKIAGSPDVFPKIYWTAFGSSVEVYSKASGKYLILACTASNPCGSVTRNFTFYTGSTGYFPFFTLYPNPTSDDVTIALNTGQMKTYNSLKTANSSSDSYEIQIWNSTGLVKTISSSQQSISLSLGSFPKGFYYVHLIQNKKIIEKQILILR